MKNKIKWIIKSIIFLIIKKEKLIRFLDMNQRSSKAITILTKLGYFTSVENSVPLSEENQPLPWYTYPAIEYLVQLDLEGKTIFEWGCGNSSLFFVKKAKEVICIEDNKEWFEKIQSTKQHNLNLFYLKDDEYINKISSFGRKFDVIIIDASYRLKCAEIAPKYLAPGGMIILDNSDWYKNSAEKLRENNLIQVDFFGFGPINNYTWVTSFFFSRDFNFVSKNNIQPSFAIGGLTQILD